MPEYALFGCPVFNICRSEDGGKENVSAEWHGARVRKDGKRRGKASVRVTVKICQRVSLTEDTRQYE